jgi:hypothetical protein
MVCCGCRNVRHAPRRGTSEKRLRGVQGNSFGEGCAYGLDPHTIKIQAAQQFLLLRRSLRLEGSALAEFGGVVGLLCQGDAECPGIHRDLGDKAVTTVFCLDRRAAQGLANLFAEAQGLLTPAGPNPRHHQGSG